MPIIIPLIAAVLGLLAGGVVNMLADDLPARVRVLAPHYADGSSRPFLGLAAFARGRRASPGGSRLSWRYPLVEVALAAAFAALAAAYPLNRLILIVVLVPTALIAVLDALLTPNTRPTLVDSLAGGALGFGVFWLFWYGGVLFNRARYRGEAHQEVAFGFGDVMLAGVCGLILGWQAMIFAMFITVFAGAFGGLAWMLSRLLSGSGYALFTALPYGPYVIFGTVVMLFFEESVQRFLWASWRWS